MKKDIEAMTSGEWLNYREDLVNEYYRRGNVLRPNIECRQCDPVNGYICFECELLQLSEAGIPL